MIPALKSLPIKSAKPVQSLKKKKKRACSRVTRDIALVVACAMNCTGEGQGRMGIGFRGKLPWRIREEMAHFKRVTLETSTESMQNAVIMGRLTWESIPLKFRPLSGRLNIVLSSSMDSEEAAKNGFWVCRSLEDALERLSWPPYSKSIENVFSIGGSSLYREILSDPLKWNLSRIIMTQIESENPIECDRFFPSLKDESLFTKSVPMSPSHEWTNGQWRVFEINVKAPSLVSREIPSDDVNREELQYLDLIQRILDTGVDRPDRTGTGTLSLFGASMRFSLRENRFPLLTTKRTFWKGVAEELLWFLAGCTDARKLSEKGVKIWDGNGSREFLDSRGLTHYREGDLGPVYGFQWRHFGAKYTHCSDDYAGQGVDQLRECIRQIKENPFSRRIVMTAWNPSDLSRMALPPCHMFCQFFVNDRKELSCQMYQRSADMGLGVPFNIASYALLTRLVARATGLECNEFIHVIGDAHVYKNHIEPLKNQLKRTPRPFPTLKINPNKTDIDSFLFSDFEISGYKPHPRIPMKMAL